MANALETPVNGPDPKPAKEITFRSLPPGGDFHSATTVQPELRLMVMILEDAVGCYQRFVDASDGDGRAQFRDAEKWLFSDEQEWIFSFRSICDFVGLNPGAVRRNLLRWRLEVATQSVHGRRRASLHRNLVENRAQIESEPSSPPTKQNPT
jgi:hypothetical protein